MAMQKKEFHVPAQFNVNMEGRIIEGYASVFNVRDFGGDVIEKGAYMKSISERFPKGRVKVLREHKQPIGMPTEIKEDAHGLFTRSKISETDLGTETLVLAQDGVLDGMSVGISILQQKFGDFDGKSTRFINEAMLHEFSIVAFPMNDDARVTTIKSVDQAFGMLMKMPDVFDFLKESRDLTREELELAEKAADQMIDLVDMVDRKRGQYQISCWYFSGDAFKSAKEVEEWMVKNDAQFTTILPCATGWKAERFPLELFTRTATRTYEGTEDHQEGIEIVEGLMDREGLVPEDKGEKIEVENKSLMDLMDLVFQLPGAIEQVVRPESLKEEAKSTLELAAEECEATAKVLRSLLGPDDATEEIQPVDATPEEEPVEAPLSAVRELLGELARFSQAEV